MMPPYELPLPVPYMPIDPEVPDEEQAEDEPLPDMPEVDHDEAEELN